MTHTEHHSPHPKETPPLHDAPDAWHDHSHDAQPQQAHGEVSNAGKIITTGLALFMMIVFAVIAVYGYYTHYTTQRLTLTERASSIGPATDALKYKYDAINRQINGGEVDALDSENKPKQFTHASLSAAREIARGQYTPAN